MEKSMQLFSQRIKEIRQKLCFSQADVSEQTGISLGTLRGLENGKVMPRLDTLKFLSNLYKHNLIEVYATCLVGNYQALLTTYNRAEAKIAYQNYAELGDEITELIALREHTSSEFFATQITQRMALLSAIILTERDNDRRGALRVLTNALKQTTPTFSTRTYEQFYYSDLEKRLLMTIGLLSRFTEHKPATLKLFQFVHQTSSASILHIKACYHLALYYIESKQFQLARDCINEGKEHAQEQNQMYSLGYFGLAEAKLAYQHNEPDWQKQAEQINLIRNYFNLPFVAIETDALPLFY
ncbi:helix-turn-helix domain-containing protein [Amphibacillus marinus]|nr:helix-turn-helix transcriptional regulator [Amphibacillus marinus]